MSEPLPFVMGPCPEPPKRTNAEQMHADLWEEISAYAAVCDGETGPRTIGPARMKAVAAIERALQNVITCAQADLIASLEAGIKAESGGCYPDWVYSARDAIQHRDKNIPWLNDLLEALGWNGGNIHDALNAVRRLVDAQE